jgi:hypothetical protein
MGRYTTTNLMEMLNSHLKMEESFKGGSAMENGTV